MAKLETREAKTWTRCTCCSEQIRTCEKYLQVTENGRNVRGERYCLHCEKYARMNNDIDDQDDDQDDGEEHLREMEDFAAYRAAGCTEAFWTDREAGY